MLYRPRLPQWKAAQIVNETIAIYWVQLDILKYKVSVYSSLHKNAESFAIHGIIKRNHSLFGLIFLKYFYI